MPLGNNGIVLNENLKIVLIGFFIVIIAGFALGAIGDTLAETERESQEFETVADNQFLNTSSDFLAGTFDGTGVGIFDGEAYVVFNYGADQLGATGDNWTEINTSLGLSPLRNRINLVQPNTGQTGVPGTIFIAGEDDSSFNLKNDVWKSTDGGATWTNITNNTAWSPRRTFGFASFDNRIWVIGGDNSTGFTDVWYSNATDGATWTLANATAFTGGQEVVQALTHNSALWAFRSFGGSVYQVWNSTDGIAWELVSTTQPWEASEHPTFESFGGFIYMIGGNNFGASSGVWRSSDGVTWENVTTASFTPRFQHASIVFNGRLWVTGGRDPIGSSLIEDVQYTTDGGNWTTVALDNGYEARLNHEMAVSRNNHLLIVGGGDQNNPSENRDDVWISRGLWLGSYISPIKTFDDDRDGRGDLTEIQVATEAMSDLIQLEVIIQTSNDGFSTIAESQNATITGESTTIPITLNDSESVRSLYSWEAVDFVGESPERIDWILVEAESERALATPGSISGAFSLARLIPLIFLAIVIGGMIFLFRKVWS